MESPDTLLKRCCQPLLVQGSHDPYISNVTYQYCALNVMLDEAVGNLTCALKKYGMADNTILILVSDNGGEPTVPGNSYPFIGNKGTYYRGGLSATGLIHSNLLPESARGGSYEGQMHVTDWLPTLMGLATNNQWTGSLFGAELDGVDQWDAITTLSASSPRSEIVHYHNGSTYSVVQVDMVKLNLGDVLGPGYDVQYVFAEDQSLSPDVCTCASPSLMDYATGAILPTMEAMVMKATGTSPILSDTLKTKVATVKAFSLLLALALGYLIYRAVLTKRRDPGDEHLSSAVGSSYGATGSELGQSEDSYLISDYRI